MTKKEELLHWLNDAYSMETGNIKVLEEHIRDAKHFPEIQSRLRVHLGETRQHAGRIKNCIESLGGTVSKGKATLGKLLGRMQAISTGTYKDELVKNALADSATEHFEVACYRSLIAAAEDVGESSVIEACRKNLQEDQAMADWVDAQVPDVTRKFLESEMTRTE
jgi:ferritin-like metal-binding protein YciE